MFLTKPLKTFLLHAYQDAGANGFEEEKSILKAFLTAEDNSEKTI